MLKRNYEEKPSPVNMEVVRRQRKRMGDVELVVGYNKENQRVLIERYVVKPVVSLKMLMANYGFCLQIFFYLIGFFWFRGIKGNNKP